MACVNSAKIQLIMLTLLLQNGGERVKQIVADFKPPFASKEEYLAYIDELSSCGDRIDYCDNDLVRIHLK